MLSSSDLTKNQRRWLMKIYKVQPKQELVKRGNSNEDGIQLDVFIRVTKLSSPLGQRVFEAADVNHDSLLDFYEFIGFLSNLYNGQLPKLSRFLFDLVNCRTPNVSAKTNSLNFSQSIISLGKPAHSIKCDDFKFLFNYMPLTCSRCRLNMGYSKDLDKLIAEFFEGQSTLSEEEFNLRIISKPCLIERLLQSILNCLPNVFDKVLIKKDRLRCEGLHSEEVFNDVRLNGRHTQLKVICTDLCFFDSLKNTVPYKIVISRGLYMQPPTSESLTLIGRNCVYNIHPNSAKDTEALVRLLIEANTFRSFYDDYAILNPINSGGFGKVFLAKHRRTACFVAAKLIEKDLTACQEILLQNEVTVMTSTSHPSIIELLDIYEDLACLYIVMEYLPYGTAQDWLCNSTCPVSTTQLVAMLNQTASAIEYLHSCGIVHRDIKLSNILVCDPDKTKFKLIDFGLACFLGPGQAVRGCVGSWKYMPPEMYLGKAYNKEADCWSFGIIAYFAFTRTFPFEGSEIVRKVISMLPDWKNKHLNDASITLLKQLLARHPELRLQMREMLELGFLEDLDPPQRVPVFLVRRSPFKP